MSFAGIAATAILGLIISCGAAAAGPLRPFQLGLWSGGAYTDDRTGSFSHCSAGVAYDGGINLFVVNTEAHGWWFGFWSSRWIFTPNANLPTKLQFDGRPPVELPGSAAGDQTLLVAVPGDSGLVDRFLHSSQLNLILQEHSYSFNLSGTSAVISELNKCVRTSLALEAPSPPQPSSPSAPASASPPEAAGPSQARYPTGGEEVELARSFLLAARLLNARLIDTDKPAALAKFNAVWRSDNGAGAVRIVPPNREITGMGIASELINVDPRLCKGNFSSARSTETVDGSRVFRAVLSCAEGHDQLTAQYLIAARRNGAFAVFAVVGNSGANGVAADGLPIQTLERAAVQAAGPGD